MTYHKGSKAILNFIRYAHYPQTLKLSHTIQPHKVFIQSNRHQDDIILGEPIKETSPKNFFFLFGHYSKVTPRSLKHISSPYQACFNPIITYISQTTCYFT